MVIELADEVRKVLGVVVDVTPPKETAAVGAHLPIQSLQLHPLPEPIA